MKYDFVAKTIQAFTQTQLTCNIIEYVCMRVSVCMCVCVRAAHPMTCLILFVARILVLLVWGISPGEIHPIWCHTQHTSYMPATNLTRGKNVFIIQSESRASHIKWKYIRYSISRKLWTYWQSIHIRKQ